MAILTEEQKHAIVTLRAQFKSYVEIAKIVSEQFGIEVDRFQPRSLDPSCYRFAGGEKWRAIFEAARQAYLNDVAAVPIAHQGYRLQVLQDLLDSARGSGNHVLAASLLKQAAMETGGKFTNERQFRHTGMNAGILDRSNMSAEDAKAELRMRLAEIAEEQRVARARAETEH